MSLESTQATMDTGEEVRGRGAVARFIAGLVALIIQQLSTPGVPA